MGKEREDKHKILEDMGFKRGDIVGRKIEYDREVWAARRSGRFVEERVDLALISNTNKDYLSLPLLGSEDIPSVPSWIPRVNVLDGAVYTTRWTRPNITESNADSFTVIGGKKFGRALNLLDIPKSWRLGLLIPQRIEDGLEAAIRQQEEIRSDYDKKEGVEKKKVETVLLGIYTLTEEFLRGKMTDRKLISLAKKTEEMFKKEGMMEIHDTNWERIADFTRRAVEKDKLDRINPQRSRILARAAYLRVVEKEIETNLIRQKTEKVLLYLNTVRVETRMNLVSARDALARFGGLGKERGAAVFREASGQITSKEVFGLLVVVRQIVSSHLRPVKPAPYLFTARAAEALLVGTYLKTNEQEDRFIDTLSEGGMEDVLNLQSAEYYLRNKDSKNALTRIRNAHSLIDACLQDTK